MRTLLLIATFFCAGYIGAQTKKIPPVASDCNAIAAGANIKVTVNCETGLSKEQTEALAEQYVSILQQLRTQASKEGLNFTEVIARLKDVQSKLGDLIAADGQRRLTESQSKNLAMAGSDLAAHPGVLSFQYFGTDPEVKTYALDFMAPLGFTPETSTIVALSGNPVSGVRFAVSEDDNLRKTIPPICDELARLLDVDGIPFRKGATYQIPSGHCELTIGYRPTVTPTKPTSD